MAAPIPDFVETDGNPKPIRLAGGFLAMQDGKRLRYAISRPARASRGTILVLQGRNETIEKYFETIRDLNARGFTVAIFDWRGQGGSDRLLRNAAKGHVNRIGTYVADLGTFLETVLLRECRPPYAVLAHSMGGLVALAAIPRLEGRIERMVLSSPLVSLRGSRGGRGALPALARILRWSGFGHLSMRRVAGGGTRQPISRNVLTSDPVRSERNRLLAETAPQLFVRSLTASWLNACFTEMRRLDDSDVIAGLHLPTLVVTAGEDRVVDSAAAERLAWRMRSGHFLTLPGARHELLQERDEHRELFLAAFEGFVASVMPAVSDQSPEEAVATELEVLRAAVDDEGGAALSA